MPILMYAASVASPRARKKTVMVHLTTFRLRRVAAAILAREPAPFDASRYSPTPPWNSTANSSSRYSGHS